MTNQYIVPIPEKIDTAASSQNLKTKMFKICMFLSGFQMVYDKMVAICSDFKCLGFRISDPIQNPDNFQPNLFSTIQNPD